MDALGIQSFLDFAGQNEQDAIAGKKVNATKNQGIAKTLIKNTSTALSVMFDNWYDLVEFFNIVILTTQEIYCGISHI